MSDFATNTITIISHGEGWYIMAEDEQIPQEQEAAPAQKPITKKKKHKAKAKANAAKITQPKAPAKTSGAPNKTVLLAVYIILGLLVVATSFYTGYLVGKMNSASNPGTQTGGAANGLNGKLQIIEYSDYQCPFCGRVEPTIEQIRKDYAGKVEIVYKNYPLDSIHPFAMGAAIAAECARDQGKFWEYHDKLFQNQEALDVPQLKQYAADLGLDTAKFNTCVDTKAPASRIAADIQEAESHGVQGTPSFWIKDELVVGAQPYATFKAKIDEKLSGKAAAPAPAAQQPSAPAPAAKVDVAPGRYVMGNANAKVEIVEFSDFQCPFCKRFVDQNEGQMIADYIKTGKAKLTFRNFPLPFHQNAQIAAEAGECAGLQGKFWEMHDVMFAKGTGDGTGLDVASLKQYAADLKLDTTKFNTCLDNHETASIVAKDQQDGSTAGVQGTPTTFINGKAVVGAVPYSNIKAAIDAELQ